jgi:hypothetical protein
MGYLSPRDIQCLRVIARWFLESKTLMFRNAQTLNELGVGEKEFSPIMRTLEQFGAVSLGHVDDGEVHTFQPLPGSLQVLREVESKEQAAKDPPDIVAQLQARARRNPWTARLIVVVLVLTAVCSIADSVTALIARIMEWIK